MDDYLKCLAAYLTGWLVANAVFNRSVHKKQMKAEWRREKEDIARRVGARVDASLCDLGFTPEVLGRVVANELSAAGLVVSE